MPAERARPEVQVFTVATAPGRPWWWPEVEHAPIACTIAPTAIVMPGGRPKSLLSLGFLQMAWRCARALFRARRRDVPYVFTFEGGWLSFIVAMTQTVLFQRRPRHVILQFIMRERQPTAASRLKYAFMRVCFRSVYRFVCSARRECAYYAEAFGWPEERFLFVPFHTTRDLLEAPAQPEEPYAIAAGRTFRDYPTLLRAIDGEATPLTIVATPASLGAGALPSNVQLIYDIPFPRLVDMIARSAIVILPLVDRRISIGQSVLLQAMALGKPVIVTAVPGTVDYVEHMETGVLVPPGDAEALRTAIRTLWEDPELRRRIGAAGKARVAAHHLPGHYVVDVARVLADGTADRSAAGTARR
jgi:glycosyltransferase involved in cell wall biosynthesis